VPYLNAVPLTHGIEAHCVFLPPAQLATELRAGRLDAALVSVTEALLHGGYDVLDGVAIASDGPVASVFLAHRKPLEEIRTIHLDSASCTSVNLLRVLLAQRGLRPEFQPLPDYAGAVALDDVLLIGNPAIEFRRAPHPHTLWDLGQAWRELTGKPFVYAVWALRHGVPAEVRSRLLAAKAAGLAALPQIVQERPEYDLPFRRAYLGGHIRYELGPTEKAGLAHFADLLGRHTGREIFPPRYI
jgi:predicted solute-binding protein